MSGAFRFHEEFRTAVSFIADGLVDVSPLLTAVVSAYDVRQAFDLAADKCRRMRFNCNLDRLTVAAIWERRFDRPIGPVRPCRQNRLHFRIEPGHRPGACQGPRQGGCRRHHQRAR
ncbi:hypothetical protein MESS2_730198 [Mesorhizobium metallidurans STM 2683]|uniref:Uncharacterized protein n=1 Tax=Mesorhizobium metallidurans STM 2683 TaxID=1297569 RepID=M5EVQ7_9HYPH|nr:hypothetical protein MESS2_730198 [Mesorhizobium metallidurans STM 2683]